MAPESLLAVLSLTEFTPQANGDRCSFHLGVFQGIVFIHRKALRKNNDSSIIYLYLSNSFQMIGGDIWKINKRQTPNTMRYKPNTVGMKTGLARRTTSQD